MFSFDFTVISFWGFVIFTILFRLRFVNTVHGSNLIQLLSPAPVIASCFVFLTFGLVQMIRVFVFGLLVKSAKSNVKNKSQKHVERTKIKVPSLTTSSLWTSRGDPISFKYRSAVLR